MENRQIKRNNRKIIIALIILMLVISCLFSIITPFKAVAENENDSVIEYTSVLEDLQKDENFDVNAYPINVEDYSLQVIQIAESSNNELFIYVYQPSGQDKDLRATSINLSTEIDDNLSYSNYELKYLNSSNTFYKYKVEDFVVKNDILRYYDISSIFRNWNSDFDEETGNDNEISEVSYEVAKLYTVVTVDGAVFYSCKDTDVVELTGKYAGFLRYNNSVIFNSTWTDAHFVAFSTNYEIDNLIEAEVSYVETLYKRVGNGFFQESTTEILDGPYNREVSFTADDEGDLLVNNSWFPHNYSFKRIVSIDEFKEIEDLTSSAEENLEGMQWVLRFAETERLGGYDNTTDGTTWYDVSNITLLTLKFEMDGIVYNLGVVDNKQTGDEIPDNNLEGQLPSWQRALINFFNNLSLGFKIFFGIILVLILIVIVYGVYKLFKWLFESIKKLFGGE